MLRGRILIAAMFAICTMPLRASAYEPCAIGVPIYLKPQREAVCELVQVLHQLEAEIRRGGGAHWREDWNLVAARLVKLNYIVDEKIAEQVKADSMTIRYTTPRKPQPPKVEKWIATAMGLRNGAAFVGYSGVSLSEEEARSTALAHCNKNTYGVACRAQWVRNKGCAYIASGSNKNKSRHAVAMGESANEVLSACRTMGLTACTPIGGCVPN